MTSPVSPFAYEVGDDADAARERSLVWRWLPMTVGLAASAILIILTVVNVFASGIPNPSGGSAWESSQSFPMIPLPSWLTIPIGFLPLLTAILLWPAVDARHKALVTNTIVYTLTVFLLLPVLLSGTYSEPGGLPNGDRALGWHWLAVPVVLVAAIVLIVRRVTLRPSPVAPVAHDASFLEEVQLRRKARYDRRARATLESDLADLEARRASARGADREADA